MKNLVLDDIVKYAASQLTAVYGYCGVASGDDMALLNTDDKKGNDIKIVITSKPDGEKNETKD